ncbi:MAG: hypothetical protein AB1505_21935 [Candidatus Latescibacterota bacterium]
MACSPEAYRGVLRAALESGYVFGSMEDCAAGQVPGQCVLLRHDVDYSLERAVQLARLNAECGVRGTFFVQVRSPVYNLLHPASLDCCRELAAAGQELGLHAPYPDPGEPAARVVTRLAGDVALCEEQVGVRFARVVAWHNPPPRLGEQPDLLAGSGLASAYHRPLFVPGCYLADSNLRNRADDFVALFRARSLPLVQVLIHPLYWIAGGSAVGPILEATFAAAAGRLEAEFLTNPNWRPVDWATFRRWREEER